MKPVLNNLAIIFGSVFAISILVAASLLVAPIIIMIVWNILLIGIVGINIPLLGVWPAIGLWILVIVCIKLVKKLN